LIINYKHFKLIFENSEKLITIIDLSINRPSPTQKLLHMLSFVPRPLGTSQ